jgi:hypothetical protein
LSAQFNLLSVHAIDLIRAITITITITAAVIPWSCGLVPVDRANGVLVPFRQSRLVGEPGASEPQLQCVSF